MSDEENYLEFNGKNGRLPHSTSHEPEEYSGDDEREHSPFKRRGGGF